MMQIRSSDRFAMIDVCALKPYENNARINDHAVPALCESIKRFGFNSPIVITSDIEIICGHTRLKAAKKLGMKKVPCVFVEGLSDEEINAYRLADNKVGEIAMWDFGKFDSEIAKIGNSINMIDFGFKPEELDPTLREEVNKNSKEEAEESEEETEEERRPMLHKCPSCGEIFED